MNSTLSIRFIACAVLTAVVCSIAAFSITPAVADEAHAHGRHRKGPSGQSKLLSLIDRHRDRKITKDERIAVRVGYRYWKTQSRKDSQAVELSQLGETLGKLVVGLIEGPDATNEMLGELLELPTPHEYPRALPCWMQITALLVVFVAGGVAGSMMTTRAIQSRMEGYVPG